MKLLINLSKNIPIDAPSNFSNSKEFISIKYFTSAIFKISLMISFIKGKENVYLYLKQLLDLIL